jgi:SAM-dependent methyltransferase
MRTRLRRLAGRAAGPPQPLPELVELSEEDRRYLTSLYDDSVPLPAGAEERLRPDHPRLAELRAAYDAVDLPVRVPSRWSAERVESFLDLRWFRGETLITWHYRELPRISRLKYYVMLRYVAERDRTGLLERLDEDGLFGCWTFSYPGHGRVSRDLLESVNELEFLDRELGLSTREGFSVLDIGAGYGRLAHRMASAFDNLRDYCCVDAIAESTFLSEYYLGFRGVAPLARVVPLHELDTGLEPGAFDLAVNIHSFSECTLQAIEWWVGLLARLRVPEVVIVPNEPTELLSLEPDGSRQDFAPALAAAGYELTTREAVYADPAVSDLVQLGDRFHRFTLRS